VGGVFDDGSHEGLVAPVLGFGVLKNEPQMVTPFLVLDFWIAGLARETVALHGLGTYCVLFGSWAAACLPFHCLDVFQWMQHRRLQPQVADRRQQRAKALDMIVLNWCWLVFALVGASPILAALFPLRLAEQQDLSGVSGADGPAPLIIMFFLLKVGLCFIIDDVSFYLYHRVLHAHPSLYERFHKPHHVFTAPFCWCSHAVHPVEMLLQSVGAMTGVVLFSALQATMPRFLPWSLAFGFTLEEYWCWLALRQLQGVLDHTGYGIPWTEFPGFGLFPLVFGGTEFHDEHHRQFRGNYASCFAFIDDVFGTRLPKRLCRTAPCAATSAKGPVDTLLPASKEIKQRRHS